MTTNSSIPGWRLDASRIVEDLFAVTTTLEWDRLLDLRAQLLSGADWNAALNAFLTCREKLESDHYLPFYRLRRLLDFGLRLETTEKKPTPSLAEILKDRYRSLDEMTRALRREWFEFGGDVCAWTDLRVVERQPA